MQKYVPRNKRLIAEYDRLRKWGEESLMKGICEIDTHFGKPCFGVTVQLPIDAALHSKLHTMQRVIEEIIPGKAIPQPLDALHITVDPVLLWTSDHMDQRKKQWSNIEDNSRREFRTFAHRFSVIPLEFTECIAVQNAVLIGAYDEDDSFASVRGAVRSDLGAPADTPFRNTVIHCVLVRYAAVLTPIEVEKLLAYTSTIDLQLPMLVNELELRKELVYPGLEIEVLERVRLRKE